MAKQTQYQRIVRHLESVGKFGANYHELMRISNCPWRRISELEGRGYQFKRWSTTDTPARTMVALVAAPKG